MNEIDETLKKPKLSDSQKRVMEIAKECGLKRLI